MERQLRELNKRLTESNAVAFAAVEELVAANERPACDKALERLTLAVADILCDAGKKVRLIHGERD